MPMYMVIIYGLLKILFWNKIEKGEIVILEIDVQGALQVKEILSRRQYLYFYFHLQWNELKNRISKKRN